MSDALVPELVSNEELQTHTTSLIERARTMPIRTNAEWHEAGEVLKSIKRAREAWREANAKSIKTAHESHKAALELWKKLDTPSGLVYDMLKDRAKTYAASVHDAQKAQPPDQSQIEKILGDQYDAAVEAGDDAKAHKLLEQVSLPRAAQAVMPMPVVVHEASMTKVSGISITVPYTYDIYDESQLPREYLMPDRKRIKAVVDAMEDKTNIPGVSVRPDVSLRISAKG